MGEGAGQGQAAGAIAGRPTFRPAPGPLAGAAPDVERARGLAYSAVKAHRAIWTFAIMAAAFGCVWLGLAADAIPAIRSGLGSRMAKAIGG